MFEHFQKRLDFMVASNGLTESDVKELIRELRSSADFKSAVAGSGQGTDSAVS